MGRDEVLANFAVSRETAERLDRLVNLVGTWQARINLIAPASLPVIWARHVADSLQLPALRPDAARWLDLGSGGGFPGLVIGAVLAERSSSDVHLVESNTKKAAFLRAAARACDLPVRVTADRIERMIASVDPPNVVTARALAPLPVLVEYVQPLLKTGVVALFPKGKAWADELTMTEATWHLDRTVHPSRVEPEGCILEVSAARRREPRP